MRTKNNVARVNVENVISTSRVKTRLEKERPERIEPFMKGAQVLKNDNFATEKNKGDAIDWSCL